MLKGERTVKDKKKSIEQQVIVRDVAIESALEGQHFYECFLVASDKTELMVYLGLIVNTIANPLHPDGDDDIGTELHRMTNKDFTPAAREQPDFDLYHYFCFMTYDNYGAAERYFALPKEMDVDFDTNSYRKNTAYVAVKKWYEDDHSESGQKEFYDSQQWLNDEKFVKYEMKFHANYAKRYLKSTRYLKSRKSGKSRSIK